jgi:WD40 repeat protein
MSVEVEARRQGKPLKTFQGHRGEITCVAVSNIGEDPFIISGSEDGTARVWKRSQQGELQIWRHPSAVRSVACSPASAGKINWCLTGCADGSVRLWNLDEIAKNPDKTIEPKWEKKDQHLDTAINCLAFSPDGKYYATGGEDNLINLWLTETGEKVYQFDSDRGHGGAVTALAFTPDFKNRLERGGLVSAGKDNKILVWTLHEKGAHLNADKTLGGRSGNVTSLGVSPDGKYLLYDQGKKLQVMGQARGQTVGVIQDPSEAAPFETVAAFSPDSSLILTTTASEGRIQLWRSPTDYPRSYEVRQYSTKESASITCAAFGKDKTLAELPKRKFPDAEELFAATGTKDGQVFLWAVPSKKRIEAEKKLKGTIILRERFVDPISKQGRVWVEVDNSEAKLTPGDIVTVVVP